MQCVEAADMDVKVQAAASEAPRAAKSYFVTHQNMGMTLISAAGDLVLAEYNVLRQGLNSCNALPCCVVLPHV